MHGSEDDVGQTTQTNKQTISVSQSPDPQSTLLHLLSPQTHNDEANMWQSFRQHTIKTQTLKTAASAQTLPAYAALPPHFHSG